MKQIARLAPLAAAAALLAAGAPDVAARGREVTTLHVQVTEDDGDSPKVRMEMPVALLQALVRSIDIEDLSPDHVVRELESEGIDLRRFWEEIRDADIREFFTLETEEANVRAWREDGLFQVRIDADEGFHGRDGTHVEISIPETLMDLLLDDSGTDPEDVIADLLRHGPMTLVEVKTDDGESVKIWID